VSIDELTGTWIDTHPSLTPEGGRRVATLMAAAALSTGHVDDLPGVLVALGLREPVEAVQDCGHPVSEILQDPARHRYCGACRTARTLPAAEVPCQAPKPGTQAGARWHWRRHESCEPCKQAERQYKAARRGVAA
jgi:hypothetical protein